MNRVHSRICLVGEDLDWTGRESILAPINLYISTTIVKDYTKYIKIISDGKKMKISLEKLSFYTYNNSFFDYAIAGLNAFSNCTGINYVGMTLNISSTIPIQSGLSSSAALLLSIFRELNCIYSLHLEDKFLCDLGKHTESKILKAVVGSMDFYACARNKIILYNEIKQDFKEYDYSFDKKVEILVIYTGNSSSTKEINSKKKVRFLNGEKNFIKYLHYTEELVNKLDSLLTNQATIAEVGKVIYEAHKMMDKYLKNTNERINDIVELCMNEGAYGAKLTGCGFGGYVFCLVPPERLKDLTIALTKNKLKYLKAYNND